MHSLTTNVATIQARAPPAAASPGPSPAPPELCAVSPPSTAAEPRPLFFPGKQERLNRLHVAASRLPGIALADLAREELPSLPAAEARREAAADALRVLS